MALSDKLRRILISKSSFSEDELSQMTESQGWDWVYAQAPAPAAAADEICFTGFTSAECEDLKALIADVTWLKVVGSVTSKLAYLVTGDNPGPAKVAKATAQGVPRISVGQFREMVEHGVIARRA